MIRTTTKMLTEKKSRIFLPGKNFSFFHPIHDLKIENMNAKKLNRIAPFVSVKNLRGHEVVSLESRRSLSLTNQHLFKCLSHH
jgi:hypothetical protein